MSHDLEAVASQKGRDTRMLGLRDWVGFMGVGRDDIET